MRDVSWVVGELWYRWTRVRRWLPATRGYVDKCVWDELAHRLRQVEMLSNRIALLEREREEALRRAVESDPRYLGGGERGGSS